MPEQPQPSKRTATFDTSPTAMGIDVKSWFFGIGINKYTHFTPLHNAVKDVQDLIKLLQEQYDLSPEYTLTLYDEQATRKNIIKTLDRLQREVGSADKLLIYYSGHGHLNKRTNKGYWIPTDAEREHTSEYIRNSTVREYIETLQPLHTLLISDSCFSGSLFVRGASRSTASVNELATIPSRWAICSGRHDEEVFDGEPGANSPFAESIMDTLRRNQQKEINVSKLVDRVVDQTRSNYKQLPEGNPLYGVGHKGGQYIFNRRADAAEDWATALATDSLAGYRLFLDNHPDGKHAQLAREKIDYFTEEAAWAKAQREHTVLSYYEYDQAYPDGRYHQQALAAITELEEEMAWQKAQRRDMLSDYRKYTAHYPKGKYRKEADARIRAIISNKQEPALWEKTTAQDTPEAYAAYLAKYPEGVYGIEAENRRKELQRTAAEQERAQSAARAAEQQRQREEEERAQNTARAAEQKRQQEEEAWRTAEQLATVAAYRQYLFAYPQGRFAAEAKAALEQLRQTKSAATPAPTQQRAFAVAAAPPTSPRTEPTKQLIFGKPATYWYPVVGGGLVVLLILTYGLSQLVGSATPTAPLASLEAFERNGKYGFRDAAGQVTIAAQYDAAGPFTNGEARVTQNGHTFTIDATGTCVLDCPPDDDETAWTDAKIAYSIAGYQEYLQKFPNGRYVADAQHQIDLLKRKVGDKSIPKKETKPVEKKNSDPEPAATPPREQSEVAISEELAPPDNPPAPVEETDEVFKRVEEMPRFPGCEHLSTLNEKTKCADNKMMAFIGANLSYPAIARENGVGGTVVVGFIVEKDGSLSNVRILRDTGAGCGQAALGVVKLMQQQGVKWIPGKQRGRPVRVQFNLPVKFRLE